MNCTELQELAALDALGVLEPSEVARLNAALAHDPDAQAEVAAIKDAAAAFASLAVAQKTPPPDVRARLLAQIIRTPQSKKADAPPAATPPARPGFHFLRPDEGEWMVTPIPGIRMKVLSVNRETGYWCVKAELAAGACYPHHEHRGTEDLYVLSGDLHNEGRVLGPGDFLHAEAGTDHGELYSPNGCVALLIEKAPDEMLAQFK